MVTEPLLHVDELRTYFNTDEGVVKAVDGVGFAVWGGARPWRWWANPDAASR